MDEHFQTCKRCSSVLEGTRNVIQLYGDERMIEAPAGFARRLEKRLAQNARVSGTRWSTWSAWLVPVAALLLFAGGLHVANSLTVTPELKSEHAQPGQGIPPDMQVVVTADAKVFHVAGCGVIHNQQTERTLTAKEAMRQGYVPCLRCMREYLHLSLRETEKIFLRASFGFAVVLVGVKHLTAEIRDRRGFAESAKSGTTARMQVAPLPLGPDGPTPMRSLRSAG
jgi:hypothetical protein